MTKRKHRERYADPIYLRSLDAVVDRIFAVAVDDRGWDWSTLAKEAELSKSTVYRLGWRVTRFPEYRTICNLADAVGLELTLTSVPGSKRVRIKTAA